MCLSAGTVPTDRKVVVLDTVIVALFLLITAVTILISLAVSVYHLGPVSTLFVIATPLMMFAPWWWIPAKGTDPNEFPNVFFGFCFMVTAMGVCIALASWFGDRFQKRHPRR